MFTVGESQTTGAALESLVHQQRVVQLEVRERTMEEVWRVCSWTDSMRGKVEECHQSTRTESCQLKENAFCYRKPLGFFLGEG